MKDSYALETLFDCVFKYEVWQSTEGLYDQRI